MVDDIENCNHNPMNIRQGDTIYIGWKRPHEGGSSLIVKEHIRIL
jgi:hypothetical protein